MEENKLSPGLKAEADEVGYILTKIFPKTSYNADTGIWDFSQDSELIQKLKNSFTQKKEE